MFYYKNWERFCESLSKSGVTLCTAEQSLKLPKGERFVVLKHDVETFVANAHRLAAIEHKYGICGSYYVQAYLMIDPENLRLLKEMQAWLCDNQIAGCLAKLPHVGHHVQAAEEWTQVC